MTDSVVLYNCFAATLPSHFVAVSLARVGVGIHAFVWQGEARFVTSAVLGPPLLQVCLQLPVTFKAQGFMYGRFWSVIRHGTFSSQKS